MTTSNFQPLTPNGGLRKNSARAAVAKKMGRPPNPWCMKEYHWKPARGYQNPQDSRIPQLRRGRNFFVGRRWELGAENLGLLCWNVMLKIVGTVFLVFVFSQEFLVELFGQIRPGGRASGFRGGHPIQPGGTGRRCPKITKISKTEKKVEKKSKI